MTIEAICPRDLVPGMSVVYRHSRHGGPLYRGTVHSVGITMRPEVSAWITILERDGAYLTLEGEYEIECHIPTAYNLEEIEE